MYSNALYPRWARIHTNAGYYNEGGRHEFYHVSHSVVWQRQRSRGANQRGVVILPWTGQQCQSVQRRTQRVWSISAGFTIMESKDRMNRGPGRGRLPNENLQRISRLLGECWRLYKDLQSREPWTILWWLWRLIRTDWGTGRMSDGTSVRVCLVSGTTWWRYWMVMEESSEAGSWWEYR